MPAGAVRPRHSRIHPVEDHDYRIHYTITSPAFKRLHFSAVEMNNTCEAEIFGANESYSVARVVEREPFGAERGQREVGVRA